MALPAIDKSVFSCQRVAGEAMVKLLYGNFPMNEMEIDTVMFEVATNAILALRILHLEPGVIAVLFGKCFGDLFMAIETFEGGSFRTELMTTCALSGPGEGLMRPGKRSWRDLSRDWRAEVEQK